MRTTSHNALHHETRVRIVEHVRAHPGTSLHELSETLASNRGTVSHHVRILERAGVLERRQEGRESHFFIHGQLSGVESKVIALRRGRVLDVATRVTVRPGIRQGELTQDLSLSRKTMRTYADLLTREGLVVERRERGSLHYFPTRILAWLISVVRRVRPPPRP